MKRIKAIIAKPFEGVAYVLFTVSVIIFDIVNYFKDEE